MLQSCTYPFFITALPSEPELQQQKQLSEDVTKTNAAEKHLKQDPSPAISITTTIATTGPSGIPSQCMSSGHFRDWLQRNCNLSQTIENTWPLI